VTGGGKQREAEDWNGKQPADTVVWLAPDGSTAGLAVTAGEATRATMTRPEQAADGGLSVLGR
jgi:hypothetical protein